MKRFYLNKRTGDQITSEERLTGNWVNIPWPLIILFAPILSILFVLTMPFVGIGLLLFTVLKTLHFTVIRKVKITLGGFYARHTPLWNVGGEEKSSYIN